MAELSSNAGTDRHESRTRLAAWDAPSSLSGPDPPFWPRLSSRCWENEAVTIAELSIGSAAFEVDHASARTIELEPAPRMRAASVVKPLLAWIAATEKSFLRDRSTWDALARAAITVSDNTATGELWFRAGEEPLLASLNDRLGVEWHVDGDGEEHPSLRILVTAGELALAYAALARDDTDAANRIRRWMREVPLDQTFGVRRVACDALAVEEGAVGVKCGWFGGERAHAVVLVETEGRTVGATVLTSRRPDTTTRAAVQEAIGDDMKLAAVHDRLLGEDIRTAIRLALLTIVDKRLQDEP